MKDKEALNELLENIKKSPIRECLNNNKDKIAIFEEEKKQLNDIDKIIESNQKNMYNPLKVVVLGEVKAGKSTLVNALIERKVSYTNVVEATASILEIKYSDEESILIYKKNKEIDKLNSLNELDILVNEKREDQQFFENISKIQVNVNTNRLKEITLIDTPGLNTVTVENEERTNNYIANADVILWVLNSHHLGQSDVSEKIEQILEYGKPIICVLNRIDEIDCDEDELIEYVKSEMGYMFREILAISAKEAWEGYLEQNKDKVEQSNINKLYNYIAENIEKNSKAVQLESILESIQTQILRDRNIHRNSKEKLQSMLEKLSQDEKDLNKLNNTIKDIISNKISEWIEVKFFTEEKDILINSDSKEFLQVQKKYFNSEYINYLINSKYEELSNYISSQWKSNVDEIIKKHDNKLSENIEVIVDKTCLIDIDDIGDNQTVIMDGAKQGGATAGAVGLGLAGYSAWLGPAAAHISIGAALTTFLPPLLIIGAVGGGVWKLLSDDKAKIAKYDKINKVISEIKIEIRNNVIEKMKEQLNTISDNYYNQSIKVIMSMLEQCSISKYEVELLCSDIEKYVDTIDKYI